jgi:STE24 endopeptidase
MAEPLIITIVLVATNLGVKLWLEYINCRHTLARAGAVPSSFIDTVDEATYRKSVEYTLAKSRLHGVEVALGALALAGLLLSGLLPRWYESWLDWFGASNWAKAAFIFGVGLAASIVALPLDWYAQFHLEERFGFNTSTARLWWLDRLKGFALSLLLGFPLLWLVLIFFERASLWWLWAWMAILGFQLLMAILAPVLILPLFNKFTPLPQGALLERLTALAQRTGFKARAIQVMDMLVWSAVMLLAGLYAVAWLANQTWFFAAFGFKPDPAIALLLFGLLSGVVGFWFTPLLHWWSRRYEYEADAFAAAASEPEPLITALRKLSTKNLSNLTPHPLYSRFYYSHPTLLEREAALKPSLKIREACRLEARDK